MRVEIILGLIAIGACLYGIGFINGRRKGFADGVRRIIADRNKPIFSILVGVIEAKESLESVLEEIKK